MLQLSLAVCSIQCVIIFFSGSFILNIKHPHPFFQWENPLFRKVERCTGYCLSLMEGWLCFQSSGRVHFIPDFACIYLLVREYSSKEKQESDFSYSTVFLQAVKADEINTERVKASIEQKGSCWRVSFKILFIIAFFPPTREWILWWEWGLWCWVSFGLDQPL